MRRRRSALAAAVSTALAGSLVAGAALGAVFLAHPVWAPRPVAPRISQNQRQIGQLQAAGRAGSAAARRAVLEQVPGVWVLPTVDKDVHDFHSGRTGVYAWVQTSETLYIFAPLPEGSDPDRPPKVELQLQNEGAEIRFAVAGADVVRGVLTEAIKPGTEIWMIEDAADGRAFAVAEMDKLVPGKEWTSVLKPEVSFLSDYSSPTVELPELSPENQEATVEATLRHLQRKYSPLLPVAEGDGARQGDVLKVDMRGFEIGPDGGRGQSLDLGAAQGLTIELTEEGMLREIHGQLEGIRKGEARDVSVTLKQRAGELAGRPIICEILCRDLQRHDLPALDDEFARGVKQAEIMLQAGTEEGLDDDDEAVQDFTLEKLRNEIANEVLDTAEKEAQTSAEFQLTEGLRRHAQVQCKWADVAGGTGDAAELQREEELAAILHALAQREGLLNLIDNDQVERETWDVLGTPKNGDSVAEVGHDPAREFQAARSKVFRRHVREKVVAWLEERAEIVEPDPGQ